MRPGAGQPVPVSCRPPPARARACAWPRSAPGHCGLKGGAKSDELNGIEQARAGPESSKFIFLSPGKTRWRNNGAASPAG